MYNKEKYIEYAKNTFKGKALELVLNNINVYRIVEHNKSLEQEFFDMVGNHD